MSCFSAMLCCAGRVGRPPKSLVRLDTKRLPKEATAQRQIWGKVMSVYDGDTITVAMDLGAGYVAVKCRMRGYDSPEMKPPKAAPNRGETKRKAVEARDFLVDLLGGEYSIHKFHSTGREKYGRLLVDCRVGDQWVSDVMIREGHGYKYDGGTKAATI